MYVELVKRECYISSQLEDTENTAAAAISGPLGEHEYFHFKMRVHFFTVQSGRVTQVFLTYPMCGNLHYQHFKEQISISVPWL